MYQYWYYPTMIDKESEPKKIPLVFFATDKGKEPVRK